jgi:integrase
VSRAATSTTGVWSRRPAVSAPDGETPGRKRWGTADIVEPAAPAANLPEPFGDLSRATIDDLTHMACSVLPRSDIQLDKRRRSIRRMAEHLSQFPGDTWQQRWEASGFEDGGSRIGELNPPKTASWTMTSGFSWLVAMRVLVPSLPVLVRTVVDDYAPIFVACQQDKCLEQIVDRIDQAPTSEHQKHRAKYELALALTSLAIPASDLAPAGLVHFGLAFRDTHTAKDSHERKLAGSLIWEAMHGLGLFPDGTPPTMRVALVGGKKSVAELVDTYGISNPAIRQVFIDYISHRAALGMDYSTTTGLVRSLVRNYWSVIQRLEPAQDSLALSEALYESWRREVDTVTTPEGPRPRRGIWDLLIAVRAFYLDIQSWAHEDPARWGLWVTRCPIPPIASRGYAAERRRLSERVADRTRLRQPLLEALVDHVADRYQYADGLLRAARQASVNADFLFRDVRYEHLRDSPAKGQFPQKGPRARRTTDSTPVPEPPRKLRVRTDNGKVLEPEVLEERAFWTWAVVEVLRLTGIRHEELLEISHLSIRQYRRSNGETVGLLVITPSKTDRERVIPMSPELLHVMARLILRHVNELGHVPLLRRWDPNEREHSEPLPFLFQHSIGAVRTLWSAGSIAKMLRNACKELAASNPAFRDLHFTPHDFRRIFATDLVNNGSRSTSAQPSSATTASRPPAATSPSSTKTWSVTTNCTWPGVARFAQQTNTGRPLWTNGASLTHTSTRDASSSGPVAGPTAPRVSTSMPVSDAACSRSTRRCCHVSISWNRICSPGDRALSKSNGSARSKAWISPCSTSAINDNERNGYSAKPSAFQCPP